MHIVNLLEHLPPELIPFILKDLSNQDLKNCRSINALQSEISGGKGLIFFRI